MSIWEHNQSKYNSDQSLELRRGDDGKYQFDIDDGVTSAWYEIDRADLLELYKAIKVELGFAGD